MHGSDFILLQQKTNPAGELIDDFVFAREHFRQIERDALNLNAMIGKAMGRAMIIFGGFKQGFGWNTTDV